MSRGERVSDERAGEATETRSITRRERENFTSMSSDIKEKKNNSDIKQKDHIVEQDLLP